MIDEQCDPCPYNCLTCNISVCFSCPPTRYLVDDSCSCKNGYYDDGLSLECADCNYTCATCENSDSCTSCNATLNRYMDNGECLCPIRYYDASPN